MYSTRSATYQVMRTTLHRTGFWLWPEPTGTLHGRHALGVWLAYLVLQSWLTPLQLGGLISVSLLLGWWACTVTAQHMGVAYPSSIVWDEIVTFWLILWLIMPTGLTGQLAAFVLFRFFDAVKPGPVD